MSIPKEPRQQMINIMYLVLTAMLALNVSAEILHAFGVLNNSISKSNDSLLDKLETSLETFNKVKIQSPKGMHYAPFVEDSKRIGDEAIAYLDELMDQIKNESNGPEYAGVGLRKAEDQSTPTRILMEQGKATELKQLLIKTRKDFIDLYATEGKLDSGLPYFNPSDLQGFESAMALAAIDEYPLDEHGSPTTWERKLFEQMPMAPTMTILNKMKNDIISTQTTSVETLLSLAIKGDKPFNQYRVGIVPNGSRFIQGEKFSAEVFLAASREGDESVISVNGRELPINDDGRATHNAGVLNRVGKQTYEYRIDYEDSFGNPSVEIGQHEITVVPPPDHVAVVSPSKLNILYIGVPNPINASITGIRDNKVTASISQGSMSKQSAGAYNVSVSRPGKATVNLSGTNQLGETINLATEFEVKELPDPVGIINKKKSGALRSGVWKAQQALFAEIDHFFPYQARFEVLGFEMTYVKAKNDDNNICTNIGGTFSGLCKEFQQKAAVGDTYYFDNIRVRGPDNKTRTLPIMTFKII